MSGNTIRLKLPAEYWRGYAEPINQEPLVSQHKIVLVLENMLEVFVSSNVVLSNQKI